MDFNIIFFLSSVDLANGLPLSVFTVLKYFCISIYLISEIFALPKYGIK